MNEQSAIISAFESLRGEGKDAALATVVSVSGSAYRRPGARMLIAEDGRTWGGISGGCLERDVVRRSRGVLASGSSVICRYETTDDDDLAAGVATGCRGTVDLFIEPISGDAPGPIPWMIRAIRERRIVALATIVRTSAAVSGACPGARLALEDAGTVGGETGGSALRGFCRDALAEDGSKLIQFRSGGVVIDVFIERLLPPQELVIFGAGLDVVPVVSIAKLMGWRVSVVGVRPATGLAKRFAHADGVHVTSPEDPVAGVEVTRESAVVLMTHNYPRDIAILAGLPVRPRYLGILGPRSRTEELFAELRSRFRVPQSAAGAMGNRTRLPVEAAADSREHGQASPLAHGALSAKLDNEQWESAFAPAGLDLGAETPEEIALAIVAEIQAVLRSTHAGFLRDRDGPIHMPQESEQARPNPLERERVWREVACPM